MKVAIVHDWLVGGGAERVVYELHKLYPDAPIYTSYCSEEWRHKLAPAQVVTSYLQHWPFSKLRKFLPPLRGVWFARLKLNQYDLVISSSGAEAKFIKKLKPDATHVAYVHAPTHYYWARYDEYMKHPGFGWLDPLARLGLRLLVGPMRRWDYKSSQRPDFMIANSNFTKDQIKKYYGRDAEVIHPPVDVERFKVLNKSSIPREGFVTAGRQTPYKKIDLAIAACTQLGLPLTVIGRGPDHQKLVKLAGPSVKFVTNASDEDIVEYFRSATAFIFPGLDDFGIVAVEALAAGTPVIAYQAGGALDYIQPGKTGLFFKDQTIDSLVHVLQKFDSNDFNSLAIQRAAAKFSAANFQTNFKKFINQLP